MADDLVVTSRMRIPEAELSERYSHASGPGGQGVNTSDSRVELTFDLERSASVPPDLQARMTSRLAGRLVGGRITIAVADHRSQLANRRTARVRLAQLLREAAAPPPPKRRATKPTRGSQERRLAGKKRRSQVKRHRSRPED